VFHADDPNADISCQWRPVSLPAVKNNFDFLVGMWTSTQRRLREVLNNSDEWYEFPGDLRCWSVLDGAGNVDEVTFPTLGYAGLTVRLYDAERDEWSIYWASTKQGLGLPPQVGRFGDDGRGVFLSDDVDDGRPVRVAYIWSDITEASARWEQAFSPDGGVTWETNWVAEFRRA
jgi:hypothetical protein